MSFLIRRNFFSLDYSRALGKTTAERWSEE
jgi:hypothetical protein